MNLRFRTQIKVIDMMTGQTRHEETEVVPCDAEEAADLLRDADHDMIDHLPPESHLPNHPTRIIFTAEVYDADLVDPEADTPGD